MGSQAPVRRRRRRAGVSLGKPAADGGVCRGHPHRRHAQVHQRQAGHAVCRHHAFDADLPHDPATSEREAIELWWPWGRPIPLADGGPPKVPNQRKAVLDPSTITRRARGDVVKQVMAQTGMNRITAQRLTAAMRRKMRVPQRHKAEEMLRKGETRAAVAKAVGLSASRISAMFKGKTFKPRSKRPLIRYSGTRAEEFGKSPVSCRRFG
jgi:hypothetical protein